MATKKKVIISKFYSILHPEFKPAITAEFMVQAKEGRRWIQVGGPFTNRTDAQTFAIQYSTDHKDVEVQVVVWQ